MSVIHEDQWRAELERLAKGLVKSDGPGLTSLEWAERMKITPKRVGIILREAMKRGKLVRSTRQGERIDGRACSITVYSIAKK